MTNVFEAVLWINMWYYLSMGIVIFVAHHAMYQLAKNGRANFLGGEKKELVFFDDDGSGGNIVFPWVDGVCWSKE